MTGPARYRVDRRLSSWIEGTSDRQYAYILLAPVFAYVGGFAIWPLVTTFWMSLHADASSAAATVAGFIGFERYVQIFTGQYDIFLLRPMWDLGAPFQSAVTVTLLFGIVSTALSTVVGFGQAMVLNKEMRGQTWLRVAIILPWAVPIVIQGMIFSLFFQPSVGTISDILQSLGVFGSAPLASSFETFVIVVVADVWKQSAFMALLILAGLQSINRDLYEVANISGASIWQKFRTITLPLVMPALIVAMMFRMIAALWIYGPITTITRCNVMPSLTCMVVDGFEKGNYGTAASVAFIQAMLVALVLVVFVVMYRRSTIGGNGI